MITSNNVLVNGSSGIGTVISDGKAETPNVKKRHRRIKSSSVKNQECEGNYHNITRLSLYLSFFIKSLLLV